MPHRYQHGASEELRQADGILKEKQESKKIILENRILCVQPGRQYSTAVCLNQMFSKWDPQK